MIKLHKIILTLTVLVVIVSNILVEAQVPAPTTTTPKLPIIPPPKTPLPPPPPPPPPKTTPTAITTDIPPPPKSTEPPPPQTTETSPPPPPPPPKSTVAPPPVHSEPLSPPPSSTSAPASPSPLPPQSCNTSIDCDNTKFCDQGNCQPRSSFGEKCVNKDGCLNPLTCNKGICQYKDNESTKNHNYDIRKAAITGGIIVGIFVVGGFIFIVYRCIKKRKERKGRELTSSVYSTDGTADFDPIYPFSERTNSFSSSKPTQPSHVPTTNHYDPLPPTGTTGNGGFVGGPGSRQGYYNYYNNEYKGGYMRQNENEVTKRTMNLLQQTRGNVMIAPHAPHAPPHIPHPQHPQLPQIPQLPQHVPHVPHPPHPPHPPPHLQQNYKWNYGVPGVQPAPPAQQQLMMDQGGLFPVPSVTRQYGGSKLNNDVKKNSNNNKINNNSFNSSDSSNSNEVNSGDKQKKTQNLRDLLDSNSVDSMLSSGSENNYVESIYDTYARDFRPKTLEVKLSKETNNNNVIKDNLARNTSERHRTSSSAATNITTALQYWEVFMAIAFKSSCFLQFNKPNTDFGLSFSSRKPVIISVKRYTSVAAIKTMETVGISETFNRLKKQGKVALIPFITAGDPDLSTTAEALKVLDSCGSDIIELGVPYSDPLADGPVIQAAATRALARGSNFDSIISMLNEVVPQISTPIALFTYYNPILKRGTGKFMSIVRDTGVHGLVVPDVPLEETKTLREEAKKHGIELVLLTTPTTPTDRMKAIVDAAEGFVYLVSSVGVTGARASVSGKVQALLQEIKEATTKPVAVGFGISTPEHVKQIVGWGADGVIVGSAMVRLLGEAKSPEEGLKELEKFTRSLKSALD